MISGQQIVNVRAIPVTSWSNITSIGFYPNGSKNRCELYQGPGYKKIATIDVDGIKGLNCNPFIYAPGTYPTGGIGGPIVDKVPVGMSVRITTDSLGRKWLTINS